MSFGQLTTYQRCEWHATEGGVSCRYPGTISPVVHAGKDDHPGPWFCNLHARCDSAAKGNDICRASQDYLPPPYHAGARAALVDAIAQQIVRDAETSVPDDIRAMSVDQCRARVKEFGTLTRAGNTDWAKRIMRRVNAKETVSVAAERMARDALGILDQQREPGQDDDE